MKKRIFSLFLALMMCLALLPASVLAAETAGQTTVKIPGCNASFELTNASAEYVLTSGYNDLPEYRIALPGTGGKVSCDQAADITYGQTWEDSDPAQSGLGGGDGSVAAGWGESYPERWLGLAGKGLLSLELTVFNDGTMTYAEGKSAVAYVTFYLGFPVSYSGGKLPEDLISWQWKSTYVPGAQAGGPDVVEHVELPKYPLAKLSVSDARDLPTADTPSSWASEEVDAAIAAELVPENLRKNYTKPVSRGDAAQMLINLIEKSSAQSIDAFLAAKGVSIKDGVFTDSSDKAVLAANALGILGGVGGGKFDPNGTLTRGQIAAIISRAARTLDVNTEGYTHSFTDVSGHWSDAELGWPVYAGVISGIGDNKFDPEGKLTVEQAIAITYRAFNSFSGL